MDVKSAGSISLQIEVLICQFDKLVVGGIDTSNVIHIAVPSVPLCLTCYKGH